MKRALQLCLNYGIFRLTSPAARGPGQQFSFMKSLHDLIDLSLNIYGIVSLITGWAYECGNILNYYYLVNYFDD